MPYDYLRLLAATPFSSAEALRRYCEEHRMRKDTEWEIPSTGQRGRGPVCEYGGQKDAETESGKRKPVGDSVPGRFREEIGETANRVWKFCNSSKFGAIAWKALRNRDALCREIRKSPCYNSPKQELTSSTELTDEVQRIVEEAFPCREGDYAGNLNAFSDTEYFLTNDPKRKLSRLARECYCAEDDEFVFPYKGEISENDKREFVRNAISSHIRLILYGFVDGGLKIGLMRSVGDKQWDGKRYRGSNLESASLILQDFNGIPLAMRVPLSRVCNTSIGRDKEYECYDELEVSVSTKGIEDDSGISETAENNAIPENLPDWKRTRGILRKYLKALQAGEIFKFRTDPGKKDGLRIPNGRFPGVAAFRKRSQADDHEERPYYEDDAAPSGMKLEGTFPKTPEEPGCMAEFTNRYGDTYRRVLFRATSYEEAKETELLSDIYDTICDDFKNNMGVTLLPDDHGGEVCVRTVQPHKHFGKPAVYGGKPDDSVFRHLGLDLLFDTKSEYQNGTEDSSSYRQVPSHEGIVSHAETNSVSNDGTERIPKDHGNCFLWRELPPADFTKAAGTTADINMLALEQAVLDLVTNDDLKDDLRERVAPGDRAAIANKVRIVVALQRLRSVNPSKSWEELYDSHQWEQLMGNNVFDRIFKI